MRHSPFAQSFYIATASKIIVQSTSSTVAFPRLSWMQIGKDTSEQSLSLDALCALDGAFIQRHAPLEMKGKSTSETEEKRAPRAKDDKAGVDSPRSQK
jgi:hypothetical protein